MNTIWHQIMEAYWSYIGGPVSVWQGRWVEVLAFSVSHVLLIMLLSLLLVLFWPSNWQKFKISRWIALGVFVISLSGQGVLPFYLVPSAWRTPIGTAMGTAFVDSVALSQWIDRGNGLLLTTPMEDAYKSLDDAQVLADANLLVDAEIRRLGYAPGREVHRIKDMDGLSKWAGIVYGGPAFHEPLTSELCILAPTEYPIPNYWRFIAVFHEVAHAKGFTREIDAELLAWLALYHSSNPVYKKLSWYMFLTKTGMEFRLPAMWHEERQSMLAIRKSFLEDRPWYGWPRQVVLSLGLSNSVHKYGGLEKLSEIPPNHPFYAPVIAELRKSER